MSDSKGLKDRAATDSSAWQTATYDKNGLLPLNYVHKVYKDSQGHSTPISARIPDDMAGWAGEVMDHHPGIENTTDLLRTALHFYLAYVSKGMEDRPDLFEKSKILLHKRELERIRLHREELDQLVGQLDADFEKAFKAMDYSIIPIMIVNGESMLGEMREPYKGQAKVVIERAKNMYKRSTGKEYDG